ncbi:hypothetical protein M422DRAFT_258325 [Sphaerobolus stellatus SS14]|uniref:BUB1 N-terminal domain-containing protein n=1 Tax=Sphaerobolus stellatus (strain SS14) TaxID=990650 RepID=A0A0C9VBM9_SPHS4|nr:hypothetical protein M422DRAFT_258325 [Sphaerobolus stellatus SS14]
MLNETYDDVFTQDSSNTVVDADVIEAVKENIQPLQKGRRATALSAIFSTPHAQRDTILARKKTQFRLQVIQALEDAEEGEEAADPLDVYSRFVAWTLESYPQGQSAESGLLELLEEATRTLKDRAWCKQDPRYLKLWILYAGYVDKPSVIYSYLLANEIGTDFAQLYEEFALVLERDGRRKEADETYNLGIARRVENLDHLKKRHVEFQRRMMAAPLPEIPAPSRPAGPPTVGKRKVLGERVSRTRPPPPTTPSDVSTGPQPNGKLQIFVDPTGEAAEKAEGNEWLDLGTRASRVKENKPEVHKMGAGPLPKSRGVQRIVSASTPRITPFRDPPAKSGGGFVPFRDEDDAAVMPPPSAPSRRVVSASSRTDSTATATPMLPPATPKPTFTPFRDEDVEQTPVRSPSLATPMSQGPRIKPGAATSEAEALRKDPFKNYEIRPTDL